MGLWSYLPGVDLEICDRSDGCFDEKEKAGGPCEPPAVLSRALVYYFAVSMDFTNRSRTIVICIHKV